MPIAIEVLKGIKCIHVMKPLTYDSSKMMTLFFYNIVPLSSVGSKKESTILWLGPLMTSLWERGVRTCAVVGEIVAMERVNVIRDTMVSW